MRRPRLILMEAAIASALLIANLAIWIYGGVAWLARLIINWWR